MIQFDLSRCIGCGRCAFDCFPSAITMDEKKPNLSAPGSCIGCGHCIAICPTEAVTDPELPGDDVSPVTGHSTDPAALLSLMRSRRSCRHYKPEAPVTAEELQALLQAARACPTAKNLQGTRYITVTKAIPQLLDAALSSLGKVGRAQLQTATAPDEIRRANNFIAWAKQRKTDQTFDPLFFHAPLLLMFVCKSGDPRDAAGAAAYTELMAAQLGLGSLYSGYFTACAAGSEELRSLLGLAPDEQVARCLVLGHPDVKFQRTAPRRSISLTEL